MASIVGTNGNVAATGINADFNAWNASLTVVESDVTKFGSLSRLVVPGLVSATFTASGTMSDDAQLFGSDGTVAASMFQSGAANSTAVTLTADTGCTLAFGALITSFDISTAVGGDATFSMNGSSNGDITLAWGGS